MTRPVNLTVFLGYDSTLAEWDKIGIFDREAAEYRYFQERMVRTTFVSNGPGRDELQYQDRLKGMRILCNRFDLPRATYARRLHQIHALPLLKSDVFLTWQTSGLVPGLRAHWAWRVPLVVKLGYNWSGTLAKAKPELVSYRRSIEEHERHAFLRASHVLATTDELKNIVIKTVPESAPKITVIPNYVDTTLFKPVALKKEYDLVYVGRLNPVKNLAALLQAVEQTNASIALVGSANGPTETDYVRQLKNRYGDLGGRIRWLGQVDNEELPIVMNKARAFVLCSLTEGHPRALIEAMACGMPIIGTRAPGIGGALQHGVTGYLCDTDADSIAAACKTVLAHPALMRTMGENARRFAVEQYSFPRIVERRYNVIMDVVRRFPVKSAPRRALHYVFRRR